MYLPPGHYYRFFVDHETLEKHAGAIRALLFLNDLLPVRVDLDHARRGFDYVVQAGDVVAADMHVIRDVAFVCGSDGCRFAESKLPPDPAATG